MRDRNGRNRDAGDALLHLASEHTLAIRVLEMDVQDEEEIEGVVDQIVRETSRIDVVVNNAGLMSIGLAEATPRRNRRTSWI
jgi:NADP-dependent 3-hydroxy acid dehydrogenase YdfG